MVLKHQKKSYKQFDSKLALRMCKYSYDGCGLRVSHGNYLFLTRLIGQEETWKYTNRSEWC